MSASKRGPLFEQTPRGQEHDAREEHPEVIPRKASAAQLATRKIKSAKPNRKIAGFASSFNDFAPPTAINFDLSGGANQGGANQGSGSGSANPFSTISPSQQQSTPSGGAFGGAFGGNSTTSFPPAQSTTPSNSFANSSFPTFGGNNGSTNFNPRPPSASTFTFGGTSNNLFSASAPAPAAGGSGSGGFSFNLQPSQAQSSDGGKDSGASTAAPSGMFSSNAQNNASTPAAQGGIFSMNPTQQNSTFGGFSSNASNTAATATSSFGGANTATTSAPPSSPFAFGTTAQPATSTQGSAPAQTPASAPTTSPFAFGSTAQPAASTQESAPAQTPASAPTTSPFAVGSTAQPATSTQGSAPAQTPASAPTASPLAFGSTAQPATSAQESASAQVSTPAPTFGTTTSAGNAADTGFSFLGASTRGGLTATSAPQKAPEQTPTSTPAFGTTTSAGNAENKGFSFLGASARGDLTDTSADQGISILAASKRGESSTTPTGNLFGVFGASTQGEAVSTPAPAAPAVTFGTPAGQPATTAFSQSMFQGFGTNTQPAATTTSNSLFQGFGTSSQPQSTSTPAPVANMFSNFGQSSQFQPSNPPASVSNSTFFSLPAENEGSIFQAAPSLTDLMNRPRCLPELRRPRERRLMPLSPRKLNPARSLDLLTPSKPDLRNPFHIKNTTVESASSRTREPLGLVDPVSSNDKHANIDAAHKSSNDGQTETPITSLSPFSFKPQTALGDPAGEAGSKDASRQMPASKSFSNPVREGGSAQKPGTFSFLSTPNKEAQRTNSSTSLSNPVREAGSNNASTQKPGTFAFVSTPNKEARQTFSSTSFNNPSAQPAESVPSSAMPTLTSTTAPSLDVPNDVAVPRIGKVTVPATWDVSKTTSNDLNMLAAQLVKLNENYRTKLSQLPVTADWSSLSRWHQRETTSLINKIRLIKKESAAAKGITGNESSLSTKRKANQGGDQDPQYASPTKKARGDGVPSTPTPKPSALSSTTPKAAPPSHDAFSIFRGALSKPTEPASDEPATSQAGFRPNFAVSTPAATTGTGGGFKFLGQFTTQAKSGEEFRAERKRKDKDNDWDPEQESETQWSARWDREEARRERDLEAQLQAVRQQASAKISAASSDAATTSNGNTARSGTSTPGLIGSRIGSPAPLNAGSTSVFDTPEAAQSPSNNLFAHLTSGSTPQDQDDSDDEAAESKSQPELSGTGEPNKRKFDDTDSDSETLEAAMKRKKHEVKKPSLADRITRDNSETGSGGSEKDGEISSVFQSINGMQTPLTRAKFDWNAAVQSVPSKQSTFAGDQTFKAGIDSIKFGEAPKSAAATFKFTPATPSFSGPSTTPSKAAPSTFSFLNPAGSQPASASVSAFSSRAQTPLSETEASGKESAVETENEEQKLEQQDFSDLTATELEEFDVLFYARPAIAKKLTADKKRWQALANGKLWILKGKKDGRVLVRMRVSSGNAPINHEIPSSMPSALAGSKNTMVQTPYVKNGVATNEFLYFAFRTTELAEGFSRLYNENI